MNKAVLEGKKRELEAERSKGQRILQQHTAAVEQIRTTLQHLAGALALIDELLAAETSEVVVDAAST